MTRARVLGAVTGPGALRSACVAAFVSLIWLGAGMTFFSDEWAFIDGRSLANPLDWLRPHNEHWSTLPIILYRAMVETIGIGSYMPYLAVVAALHIGVAAFVYRLVARQSGRPWGFVGGLLVLFFGSGFENLFWGFQTGFVASMLFGLVALDITDGDATQRRAALVATLLLLSLMASGTGIVMCVAVGIEWLVTARWRHFIAWLVLPAATYLAWYLAFGRAGVATMRNPFSLAALSDVPSVHCRGVRQRGGRDHRCRARSWDSSSVRSSSRGPSFEPDDGRCPDGRSVPSRPSGSSTASSASCAATCSPARSTTRATHTCPGSCCSSRCPPSPDAPASRTARA